MKTRLVGNASPAPSLLQHVAEPYYYCQCKRQSPEPSSSQIDCRGGVDGVARRLPMPGFAVAIHTLLIQYRVLTLMLSGVRHRFR